MKVNIALIAVLLALAGTAPGQVDTVWTRAYNGPAGQTDKAFGCALGGSGHLYVVGSSQVSFDDFMTVKYNVATGDTVWTRSYDGPSHTFDAAYDCAADHLGNLYVTGSSTATNNDYLTIKYNAATGDTVWTARYNGYDNNYDAAFGCAVDAAGNLFVAGYSYGSMNSDALAIRYDPATGDTVWVARYPTPGGYYSHAVDCAVDGAGNLYAVGWYSQTGGLPDYLVIKYDPSTGDTIWTRRWNASVPNYCYGLACAVDRQGFLYVTGYQSPDTGTYHYRTIKYDCATGDTVWSSLYPGTGNNWDKFRAGCAVDTMGGLYVHWSSYNGTDHDYLTVKYNAYTGDTVWSRRVERVGEDLVGGCVSDGAYDLYVTGGSGDYGVTDFYTIKYRQQPDSSLVAHYLFNGNARDTSGHGNHGTLHNGVALTTDRFGQSDNAYFFDGIDDYIAVADTASLDMTTAITISAWIRPDTCPQPNDDSRIIGKGVQDAPSYDIFLYKYPAPGGLQFMYQYGASNYEVVKESWLTTDKVGKWFNIVGVYNGAAGTLELYSDGVNVAFEGGMTSSLQVNDSLLTIGSSKLYTGLYECSFKGAIDDIRIYNRALSGAEILAIYNAEKPFTLQPPQLIYPPDNHFASTAINFLWRGVDSAASYRFQAADNALFNSPFDTLTSDTSKNKVMGAEGQYYWRVKAFTSGMADSSNWSEVRTFHWDATAPPPPVLKGPPDNAWVSGGPNLSWSASSGADLYGVQVTDDSTFALVITDTLTTDTFRYVPPLAEGKYFWRVAAGDSNGNWSGFSQVRRFRLDTTHVKLLWHVPTGLSVQLWDTIRVRFSEPVVVSSFAFNCDPNPGGWTTGHSAGRDTFWMAHSPFDIGTVYTVTVTGALDSAGNGLTIYGSVQNPWTFTTTADGVGPVLRHTPVAVADSGTAIPLTAYATDPGSGVQQVILYYRQGGREEFTEISMTHPSDSTYQGQIPASEVSVRGVSYYLRAVDNLGAQSFSPSGAPAVRHQPRVALGNVVYGSTLSGGSYRMFAFPFETAGPAWRPSQLADDLGAYDATQWRLFRWQSGAYAEYEAVQDILPGRAYWIINRNGGTFDLADGRTVADSSFHIPLSSGWNMAGTPFNYSVGLSEVRVYSGGQNFAINDTANTLTERRMVDYDGSGYVNSTRIEAWHGYWVRALAGGVTLMVPTASATDKSAPLWNPDGWTLSLEASCGGYHDRDNRIGITPRGPRDNASEPPPVGAGVSLAVESDGSKLAEDYRAEIGRGQCWRFQVDCGPVGPVDLAWREEGERGWQYAVYDVEAGRPVSGGGYSYQSDGRGAPRTFAVLAGSPEYIASEAYRAGLVPTATMMEKVWPNPFKQTTTIRYQLTTGCRVSLAVYNVLGQRVRILADGVREAGRHSVVWDGRDGAGRRLGSGVYLCRFEAGGVSSTVRMALVR